MTRFRNLGSVLISLSIAMLATDGQAQHVRVAPAVRPHPRPIAIHWRDDDDDADMPVKEQETIRKSFSLAAGERRLEIDNVWGSISVRGASSDQVQVLVNKSIRAESKEALEQAKKEVSLDITQPANGVKLYVNGPFRCHCQNDAGCDHGHLGYVVKMDFEVQVPNSIDLALNTVNEGDITVEGVSGHYSVRNVNGAVDMQGIAGAGQARTVNGGVKVAFTGNPQSASSYSSVNGDIDLVFLPKLSADLRFKTFNGNIYTDFPMTALPQRQPTEEHQNGKFVFRADRYSGGRVAAGGPEIKIETLNGDIHIRERNQ